MCIVVLAILAIKRSPVPEFRPEATVDAFDRGLGVNQTKKARVAGADAGLTTGVNRDI